MLEKYNDKPHELAAALLYVTGGEIGGTSLSNKYKITQVTRPPPRRIIVYVAYTAAIFDPSRRLLHP